MDSVNKSFLGSILLLILRRQFECMFGLLNESRWPTEERFSALPSIPMSIKSGMEGLVGLDGTRTTEPRTPTG